MDFSPGATPLQQTAHKYDFPEVSKMLLARSVDVCRKLLPGGVMVGHEWQVGDLGGAKGKSLSVNTKTGKWSDFASDASGGDLISLWAAVEGCEQGEGKAAAERWLGLTTGSSTVERPASLISVGAGSTPVPSQSANPKDQWPGRNDKPSAVYKYRTADKELWCEVHRFDRIKDGEPDKSFRPWNGKTYQMPKGARPLYRLPEIMSHNGPIIVVEGEKAANAVIEAGYCATTCANGAQSIDKTDWSPLAGKEVLLWQDKDTAGAKWLKDLLEVFEKVGVAVARVVPLDETWADKDDAADLALDMRRAVVEAALLTDPALKIQPPFRIANWSLANRFSGEIPEIVWLVKDTIPQASIGLIAAPGGAGKSFLVLDLCLKVAEARPGGVDYGVDGQAQIRAFGGLVEAHGSVVILSAEESVGSIQRRLQGIDPNGARQATPGTQQRMHILAVPDDPDNHAGPLIVPARDGFETTPFFEAFKAELRNIPDLKLVVIDPLASFVMTDINADSAAAYFALDQLNQIVRETGATVICVHHMRKGSEGRPITNVEQAREHVRGSTGLIDRARFAYALWPASEEDGKAACQAATYEWERDKVFFGAVVKSNDRTDKTKRTYIRLPNGLLVDKTAEVIKRKPEYAAMLEILRRCIEAWGIDRHPVYSTGDNSIPALWGQGLLPPKLTQYTQEPKRIKKMVADLLSDGSIQKRATAPGYIDAKGGPFTRNDFNSTPDKGSPRRTLGDDDV